MNKHRLIIFAFVAIFIVVLISYTQFKKTGPVTVSIPSNQVYTFSPNQEVTLQWSFPDAPAGAAVSLSIDSNHPSHGDELSRYSNLPPSGSHLWILKKTTCWSWIDQGSCGEWKYGESHKVIATLYPKNYCVEAFGAFRKCGSDTTSQILASSTARFTVNP